MVIISNEKKKCIYPRKSCDIKNYYTRLLSVTTADSYRNPGRKAFRENFRRRSDGNDTDFALNDIFGR